MTPGLDEDGLRDWLVDYLVNIVGLSPGEIDCDAMLNDLAVGSADAVVLTGELSELLGRPVSPVDFWQYPTVNMLAKYLTGGEVEPLWVPETPGGAAGVSGEREPIAVIGVGCRFPGGVSGPDALWDFMVEQRSGVGEVPPERWEVFEGGSAPESAALAETTRWGGFLDDIAGFDAEFFEIAAGEADKMDPQQRLLLEVAQEALDHAGIQSQSLRHTQTGVFAGACLGEYGYMSGADLSAVDAWSGTGGALSIIANRLSYFFDLRGPSVTVDTACSSSLVAVHLACQSLRSGESDMALAAGVNVLLTPAPTRSFDVADVMSRSGACHAFDAAADGFVRAEGAGVVVLKRLSDAVRDGDRVLAVVRGSAVNQDGRSNGLMAPNPAAQMAVLRSAYVDAGVDVREVDYVEAHGTGTLLGDPIEARALGSVLGRGRGVDEPLLIGSVKSNLGHMEAAAGVAGLAKAVLAVKHGSIPATVGYENPNPHIQFDSLRLKVVDKHTDWPETGRPRRAGVSSFGFGGTNAHVVVEQAPDPAPAAAEPAAPAAVTTLVVSGKTPERVASMAGMLAQWLQADGAEVSLDDLAHTLNHHRGGYRAFATVCARNRAEAVAGLAALAAGQSAPGVVGAHRGPCRSGTVFVYSGQGSQWAGMGRRLLADEPAFAAAVDELEPAFVEQVGFSLREILASGESITGIDRIQPVLVGMQLALTELWRGYGVHPDAVIGHSMGEVTAAVVAGALTPAEGLRVIATRSRLMTRLSGQGAMALLELRSDAAAELLADYPDVSVAVEASPRQVVIAGPPDQVDAVIAVVAAQDRLARRVEVDVASHHAIIDPILADLKAELADLNPQPPSLPVFVTTGGRERSDSPVFDADHWVANLRNPVKFADAVAAAGAENAIFIEVSPNPVVTYAVDDTLTDIHHHTLGTLARDTDDTLTFHTNLNATHTSRPPDTPHAPEPHVPIPTAPWHHTHHWIPAPPRRTSAASAPAPGTLLGAHTPLAGAMAGHLWQAELLPRSKPYPGSRRIAGVEVVPPSVLLRTLTAAAAESGGTGVEDVRFDSPVTVDQPRLVQVFTDGATVTVSSAAASDAEPHWIRNATARVSAEPLGAPAEPAAAAAVALDPSTIEQFHSSWGVEGQAFEWSVDAHETMPGRLRTDVALQQDSASSRTAALLDAAMDLARLAGTSEAGVMLPIAADAVALSAEVAAEPRGVVDVRTRSAGDGELVVDISVHNAERSSCAEIRGLRFKSVQSSAALAPAAGPGTVAHTIDWQPWERDTAPAAPASAVVIGDSAAARALRDGLAGLGHPAGGLADARYVVYVADPDTTGADVDAAAALICDAGGVVAGLAERDARTPATLWIVTQGVYEARSEAALRQSPLWALGGVIGAEQPQLWGGLVDIAPDADAADCAAALSAILHTPAKGTVLLRDGALLKSGLAPLSGEAVRQPLRCRPDAAYLVTGGLGDLGLLTAGWLAERGARHLVLLGRTRLDLSDGHRVAAIRALERGGVSVETAAIDIGSAEELRALLDRREAESAPPIRGVVHAAGVTEGQLLTDLEPDRVLRTVWPKIAGAHVLNDAFPPGRLDFLYFIASAGSVFGVPGQAAYASGNAYLDALARARHRDGDNTISLDWVAWEGLGLGKDAQVVVDELERVGSRPINPAEAAAAWEYVTRFDIGQVVMAPLLAGAADVKSQQAELPTVDWSHLSDDELRDALRKGVRAILASELRIGEDQLELDLPFAEMGLNSVMAISIRRQMEQFVGIELSATMLFNHPTIAAFAGYLATRLRPDSVTADTADDDSAGSVLDSLFDTVEAT